MEIREIIIHDAVGEKPRPAECTFCGNSPTVVRDGEEKCPECGEMNATSTDFLKTGYSFIIRR